MSNDRIFVFGSNLAGKHGKGAALAARKYKGAVYGIGQGPQGNSYAIPTKDHEIRPLGLSTIAVYVKEFLTYAKEHPELRFEVTRVGCGLAGFSDAEISPLFKDAPENCDLPPGWRND